MTQPEKERVRPRIGIEEVAQFEVGVQIKACGEWSEWGLTVTYNGEGSSISPPPSPHLPHHNFRRRSKGENGRRSAPYPSLSRGITERVCVKDRYRVR